MRDAHLVLRLDQRVARRVELGLAPEERKGDDEEVLERLGSRLLDQLAGGGGGASCGDEVAAGSAGTQRQRARRRGEGISSGQRRGVIGVIGSVAAHRK